MSFFDDGPDDVLVYPEVAADDGYGTPTREPGLIAVLVPRCHVQPVSAVETQALGQGVATICRMFARQVPGGAWAKATWDGRDWDALGEPEIHEGPPATRHVTVLLRSRGPAAVA